jgi:hypothetical protein
MGAETAATLVSVKIETGVPLRQIPITRSCETCR